MTYIQIIITLLLIAAFIHLQLTKRKNRYELSLFVDHILNSQEMKRTLAMGLYLRFRKEPDENPVKNNEIFIKQNPLEFENFVADIIAKSKGGSTWVLPPTGDYGVDFEHETNDGKFLGQVKCYKDNLSYEPIALVHSNMVKENAKGGYVITTGSYSENARSYARDLNIELIDGVQLVELWIKATQANEQEIKALILEYQ